MEKLLEMKEICKSFGTNNVLKNCSLIFLPEKFMP